MSDFWQQLLGTLAGNTLLIGLAGFIGKVYIERIARKEQASIDAQAREHTTELEKRIKLLEQEHEKVLIKNEHFHQVSQETYQKAFETKVNVYTKLFSLSHKIERNYQHIPSNITDKIWSGEQLQLDDILLSARATFIVENYTKFIEIADENLTFLSQEVLDAYFIWQDRVSFDMQKNNELDMKVVFKMIDSTNKLKSGTFPEAITKGTEISAEEAKYQSKLRKVLIYSNHFDAFKSLKSIIREDIRIINQRVDNAFKQNNSSM